MLAIVKDSNLEELVAHADNIVDASGPTQLYVAETMISDTSEAVLNHN